MRRTVYFLLLMGLFFSLALVVPLSAPPVWTPNTPYTVGALVTYGGHTYRCLQAHTSQDDWTPPDTPSLWELVAGDSPAYAVFLPVIVRAPASTPTPPTPNPTVTLTPTGSPTVPSPQPGRVFAPYVDVTLWPTLSLSQTTSEVGTKFYTLAFIVSGGGCQASWGGVIPLNQNHMLEDVNALRTLGGEVIISFGGANGQELAQTCSSVGNLQAQYQAVIDRYQVTRLDFDIEGAALADPTSINRRNQAITNLQAWASSQGKPLFVSYTLPVLPTGLTQDGVNLLQSAINNGVEVKVVNIMAMDYGGPSVADPNQMGQNAIDAANSLFNQLKALYPGKTDSQVWAMVGVTPMIGLNDVVPEIFTLADAQLVLAFAQQKNIGRLAMWSVGRDKQCPGSPHLSPSCSGVTQAPWAFSNIFKSFSQ